MLVFRSPNSSRVITAKIDLSDPNNLKESYKKTLKRRALWFAVALYKDELVYLTGGEAEVNDPDPRQTSIYNIRSDEWKDGPPLNHGRRGHSSICVG